MEELRFALLLGLKMINDDNADSVLNEMKDFNKHLIVIPNKTNIQ